MIELLTWQVFSTHVGSDFLFATEGGRQALRLTEVARLGPASIPGGREPFSLRFVGPLDLVLPQQTYQLTHAAMGGLEIFIVPIGRDAEGVRYEAIFN